MKYSSSKLIGLRGLKISTYVLFIGRKCYILRWPRIRLYNIIICMNSEHKNSKLLNVIWTTTITSWTNSIKFKSLRVKFTETCSAAAKWSIEKFAESRERKILSLTYNLIYFVNYLIKLIINFGYISFEPEVNH